MRKKKKSVPTKHQSSVMKPLKKRKLMDVDHHRAMRSQFQEEIIMDILTRLPVQSLLRFKCISKFWKTLITDPYFKMKHQSHAMNFEKLLVGQWCIGTPNIFSFYSYSLLSVRLVENVERLVCPSNYKPSRYELYSSCNGLVLLSIAQHLLLWNPSTRESIQLADTEGMASIYNYYGFGYDTTSDDYKIIKLNCRCMKILALKSGLWRKTINCGRDLSPILYKIPVEPFVFLHGAFHWVGYHQEKLIVVSFSISDEEYKVIHLLEPMRKILYLNVKNGVVVLRGMLCFYEAHQAHHHPSGETICKLWVMKDYGVEESWIQLYMIREIGLTLVRPIHMFDNGEVLLSYGRMDYTNRPFRTSKGPFRLWPECNAIRQGITYTESMISPNSLI